MPISSKPGGEAPPSEPGGKGGPAISNAPDPPEHAAQETQGEEAGPGELTCPHCGQKLKKWAVPDNPLSPAQWSVEFLYICFNDWCPYFLEGWKVMAKQGRPGVSYRCVYDRERKHCFAVPVTGLQDLRYGIVEE